MIRLLVPGAQRFGFQIVFASGKMIAPGNLKTSSALATEFGLVRIASIVHADELQAEDAEKAELHVYCKAGASALFMDRGTLHRCGAVSDIRASP
jgi:hypothetical protein